eukprot:TRINITY_DN95270_c0_g1_i1.p1 TRINITY_DN95270_c0_g1~~TRINITY_DN95270_c0_g1_i1.p1  ORF type:complete len:302 (-),score=72.80 TRINITY_DN95270_c0_g1_i1:28-888(-)
MARERKLRGRMSALICCAVVSYSLAAFSRPLLLSAILCFFRSSPSCLPLRTLRWPCLSLRSTGLLTRRHAAGSPAESGDEELRAEAAELQRQAAEIRNEAVRLESEREVGSRCAELEEKVRRAEAFKLPELEVLRAELEELKRQGQQSASVEGPGEDACEPEDTDELPSLATKLGLDDMSEAENISAAQAISKDWNEEEWANLYIDLKADGREALGKLLRRQRKECVEARPVGLSDWDWATLCSQVADPELPEEEWMKLGGFLGQTKRRAFAKVAIILFIASERAS